MLSFHWKQSQWWDTEPGWWSVKLTPAALQWSKFSIIGHSMGEWRCTAQLQQLKCSWYVIFICTLYFFFILGGNVAGMVSVVTGCYFYTIHVLTLKSILLYCVVFSIYIVFPQFSALYPEMVDAVVLLDSYGFFPTETVIQQFFFLKSFYYSFLQVLPRLGKYFSHCQTDMNAFPNHNGSSSHRIVR